MPGKILYKRDIVRLPVFPGEGDLFASGKMQVLYAAGFPAFGNGGEKLIIFAVPLDEHFADQRTDAEVPVDLEGRADV